MPAQNKVIERPIIMSAAMVRAIVDGRKSMTRRLVKLTDGTSHCAPGMAILRGGYAAPIKNGVLMWTPVGGGPELPMPPSKINELNPFGAPGDRLWVRENWCPFIAHSHGQDACDCDDVNVTYAADGESRFFYGGDIPTDWLMPKAARRGNVPSIHMPRWASRITLEITAVKVERLNSISEEDARAEGVEMGYQSLSHNRPEGGYQPIPVGYKPMFRRLWDSIHGEGAWALNPFLWCVSFKRVAASPS